MTRSIDQRSCTAAVFQGVGKELALNEMPLPVPGKQEALVNIECCTICGSDVHTISGKRSEPTPSILGHEVVGVVAEVGDPPLCDIHGQPLEPGMRVTWSICVSCGSCDRCVRGIPQKCRQLTKYGHERAVGRTALSGGMAEMILLRPGTAVIHVGDEIPAEVICPVNCATATIAAAFRTAGTIENRNVLIFGAGMLGLTAASFAKSHGAGKVVVCDIDADRLAHAARFGADAAIDFASFTTSGTSAAGSFDVIVELSGAPTAVQTAIEAADVGTQVILVGTVMDSPAVQLDPQAVVRRCLSIHGVHNYSPVDLQTGVEFLREFHSKYPFGELVVHSFSLDDINQAVALALQDRPIRIAIRP